MRRILILLLTAVTLASQPVRLKAIGNKEKHALNHRHKEQRKMLKAQQRNMKKTMNGQPLAKADRKRFKQQLKTERRMLARAQKDDSKNLKSVQNFARKQRKAPASSLNGFSQ